MSEYDYGPLQSYELIWKTGHVETVHGHQVSFDSAGMSALSGVLATGRRPVQLEPKFRIHGMIDGHWRLVIAAPESELGTIRNVTERAALPASDL